MTLLFPRFLVFLLAALASGATADAQLHPAEVATDQVNQLPYRETGKVSVLFGGKTQSAYFGSGTYIHRFTGLTAGHLLYDPKAGFAETVNFYPDFYRFGTIPQTVSYFAVLDGYQVAAGVDPNSDGAFARDLGFFLLVTPAVLEEWAAFSADPTLLTTDTDFLALGYAAENFKGDQLAYVQTHTPYTFVQPGLYDNTSFYTEGGMSGGPVYLDAAGVQAIGAVNVAGSNSPDPAHSGARAITSEVRPLLLDAEYTQGLVTGGTIHGPATAAAGSTVRYKTGVTFVDAAEGAGLERRYDEIELVALGKVKDLVTVTKLKTERFRVTFASSLASGTEIKLRMIRDTAGPRAQTPLETLTVTIQ